ncbi:MAG: SDR family NAD(P)-dependent oxidoreductase [Anaerolineaceae bacterium]|nr:SDR family NAD(P)-dependent oxidoreductase [Anaerolineaceae bacterium]
METTLQGKTYVVTGATSGIGLATASALVRRGAGVIGVGRCEERCRQAQAQLLAVSPGAKVRYCLADLSLQSQIRALNSQIRSLLAVDGKDSLDGLVNNAGVFTYWLALTAEGFETQWAVNYLAPFLLTNLLLSLLMAAPAGRVVTVSSDSHQGGRLNWQDLQLRRHYDGLRAYANTKLANLLFTLEFNRLMGPHSTLKAFAADPGLVKTDIGFKGTPALVRWVWGRRRAAGVPAEKSVEGILFLLTEPSLQDAADFYWKDKQARRASRRAVDKEAAALLWLQSEQMCGMA